MIQNFSVQSNSLYLHTRDYYRTPCIIYTYISIMGLNFARRTSWSWLCVVQFLPKDQSKSEYRFTSETSRIEFPVRCYASDWKIEMAPKLMRRNAYVAPRLLRKFNRANFRRHVQLHGLNAELSDELTADGSFHAISNSSNVSQTLFADRSLLPLPPPPRFPCRGSKND